MQFGRPIDATKTGSFIRPASLIDYILSKKNIWKKTLGSKEKTRRCFVYLNMFVLDTSCFWGWNEFLWNHQKPVETLKKVRAKFMKFLDMGRKPKCPACGKNYEILEVEHTVDGRNPKQPPGINKTLQIMG